MLADGDRAERYGPHTPMVERLLSDISAIRDWSDIVQIMRTMPTELADHEEHAKQAARLRAANGGISEAMERAVKASLNRARASWAVHVGIGDAEDEDVLLATLASARAVMAIVALDPRQHPLEFGQLVYPLSNAIGWLHDIEQ